MDNVVPLTQNLHKFIATLPGDDAIQTARKSSWAQFEEFGIPSSKLEKYKYTNLSKINLENLSTTAPAHLIPDHILAKFRLSENEVSASFVFVNGHFVPTQSILPCLPMGARIWALADALKKMPARIAPFFNNEHTASTSLTALNNATAQSGVVMWFDPKVVPEKPIEILNISTDNSLNNMKHIIVLGDEAKLELVETFIAPKDATGWTNTVINAEIGEGAQLKHYRNQREMGKSHNTGRTIANIAANGRYKGVCLDSGAALSRYDIDTHFNGTGGTMSLDGVTLASGKQHTDVTCYTQHKATDCSSDITYHNVVGGKARSVFQGKFHVEQDAQRTNDNMQCRNLLLSETAKAESKPELEIHADDVKCAHGSTTGSLDNEQLFYLTSRGISKKQAKSMLIHAFVHTTLDEIKHPGVHDHFIDAADQWLNTFEQEVL